MAQLSVTDMRIPIQYALSYPRRLINTFGRVDFCKLKAFHFQAPDLDKFPCLRLALDAAKALGTAPCVLNASNEVCVDEFLKGGLKFSAIAAITEKVLSRHKKLSNPDLTQVLQADSWARKEARSLIEKGNFKA
jgi:1-deoxy-D-xylulose-5-phosphate reductoisomerase